MMMTDGSKYSHSSSAMAPPDCFTSFDFSSSGNKSPVNQRRFSDKQIKSLETVFESESKLEPRKKLQVARELGLQPRQVAIWFQNKRARWKSKQLEHDYTVLRENYNNLACQYENLKKEKQNLAIQLQKLNDKKHKSNHKSQDGKQAAVAENSNNYDQSDGGNNEGSVFAMKARPMLERLERGVMNLLSDGDDDDNSSMMNAEYLGMNAAEPELPDMVEPEEEGISQTCPDNWGCVDQSGSSYELWDFWS